MATGGSGVDKGQWGKARLDKSPNPPGYKESNMGHEAGLARRKQSRAAKISPLRKN